MTSTLTDITTIIGIESLFHKGVKDPWAKRLAGQLADLYVYSDDLRYVLPMPGSWGPGTYPGQPELILRLQDQQPGLIRPEIYSTDEVPKLKDEYLLSVFDAFIIWARANQSRLRNWMALHKDPWVREGHSRRVTREYVFSVENLQPERPVKQLANQAGLDVSDLLYAFDVVLRYPHYGMLAGDMTYYYNHPIRDAFPLPTMQYEPAPIPKVCVSFASSISAMCDNLSQEDYLKLLADLREIVRAQGLHKLAPGSIEEDIVRDIAGNVRLTPHLAKFAQAAAVVGGVVGGLGAIPALGPVAAMAGGAIAISTFIWSGKLPRNSARIRWLRWAFRWKVQDELEEIQQWQRHM